MERARRLSLFWQWLPVFRVVAETEHLPSASRTLGVTVPALSRTVGLLEAQLGVDLFDRPGKRLVLNERGRMFLSVVRDAMRLVDEGLALVEDDFGGLLVVAAPACLVGHYVVPAVERMRASTARFDLRVVAPPTDAVAALRQGEVDALLTTAPVQHRDLELRRVDALACGVWARARRADGFVAGPATWDTFPAEEARTAPIIADDMDRALACTQASQHAAVLPNLVAKSAGLVRQRATSTKLPVFVATRAALSIPTMGEHFARALRSARP